MTEPNEEKPTGTPGPTQGQRRLRYGLNVTVAIIAALALTVLFNWLIDRQIEQMPPTWRGWVRYDLTSTRQHSLSEQTIGVLKGLDKDYLIVTLLQPRQRDDVSAFDQASDLVDEYARRSPRVGVDHINPALDVGRLDAFYGRLRERYAKQLEPLKGAVEHARGAVEEIKKQASAQVAPLRRIAEDPTLDDDDLRQFVMLVAQRFSRLSADTDLLLESIDGDIARGPLPMYSQARGTYKQFFVEMDRKLYGAALDKMERTVKTASTPPSVKDGLLGVIEGLKATRKLIADTLAAVESPRPIEGYDKLGLQLASHDNLVVILDPSNVRVISLSEMFRPLPSRGGENDGTPERAFLGEEKITGALIAMGLEHLPMVVFVHNTNRSPIVQGGGFSEVAKRLANLDFRVEEWSPMGRTGPMGQPMPPGPPPEPRPGQKVVWVVLPLDPPSPQNPMSRSADQALKVVAERTAKGDSALVFVGISPASRFGPADPILQFLDPWCLKPSLDRLVLRLVQVETKQTLANNLIRIEQWPEQLPVSKAEQGMAGAVVSGSPLELLPTEGKGVTTYPLIEATAPEMWAEKNLSNFPNIKYDPATASDKFVLGAAVQAKDNRLVVISDPSWATDAVTTNADPSLRQGEGMAEIYGTAYPANAELFINSVYWLSGLDRLIAAGARSQDVRRVGAISRGGRNSLVFTLACGMPALITVTGVGVWMIRRRS
ncbi:MAG: GldG family protein [Planctomycetes bacterium]|nr:GldG family protein [Planctomycetota bacterium]